MTERVPAACDGMAFRDIKLDGEFWKTQEKHAETLYRTYSRAPHFNYANGILDLITDTSALNLGDYNYKLLLYMAQKFGLEQKIVNLGTSDFDSSLFDKRIPEEFSDSANYHNYLLCKHFGADTMITGQYGSTWLNEKVFLKHDIDILYQEINFIPYRQYSPKGAFVSGLSALDLLFNCGESAKDTIGRNSSVTGQKQPLPTN